MAAAQADGIINANNIKSNLRCMVNTVFYGALYFSVVCPLLPGVAPNNLLQVNTGPLEQDFKSWKEDRR